MYLLPLTFPPADIAVEIGADGATMYRFGVSPAPSKPAPEPIGQAVAETAESESESQPEVPTAKADKRFASSWDAKEAGGGSSADADYLYELGKRQQYNINVDTGQNSTNLDSLFTGNFLGHKSDIADGTLRNYEFRTFNNIVGDYYVAPKFLDAVTLHIAKNFLLDQGCFDKMTRVPLILGIWGGKGQGKSFQTELVFKKLGVEAVIMSAGELESEVAGYPGKMIRERYRKAAELSKVRGKFSCLVINDIDAGIGHFENTQMTVNNQMVTGTLMAICDNPNRVAPPGYEWRENDENRRVPLIVTGNDLSTVFAPGLRDGRMEKFYWQPTLEDLVNILWQMYKEDGMQYSDMVTLLDVFPNQSLDFFGALRAATYDNQIREWIKKDVIDGDISDANDNLKNMGRRLLAKEGLPKFEPVTLQLKDLLAEGERLVMEQDMVRTMKLSEDYLKNMGKGGRSMIGLTG